MTFEDWLKTQPVGYQFRLNSQPSEHAQAKFLYNAGQASAQAELEALRAIEETAREFVVDSYRPSPKHDGIRYDKLAAKLHEYRSLPADFDDDPRYDH